MVIQLFDKGATVNKTEKKKNILQQERTAIL